MGQSDLATFRRELDEFSSRLDQRIREFRERGRFSDLDQEFLTKAQDRVDRLRPALPKRRSMGPLWIS
jgi:hypothetical protein